MHMDDTNVIKDWVEGEIMKMEQSIRNEFTSDIRMLEHKMEKVWKENLLVDEFIGENEMCIFKNLGEFCKS